MAEKSAGSARKGRPLWNRYADSVIGPSICPLTATAERKRPDDNASSNAPVKQFENRIELALLHLITVACIARLNQVLDNTEALANDTLSF